MIVLYIFRLRSSPLSSIFFPPNLLTQPSLAFAPPQPTLPFPSATITLAAGSSAIVLLSGSVTHIVTRNVKIHRPPGFLSSSEDRHACMLMAPHANASLWHLFIRDRGVVDSILNKTMVMIPQQKMAAAWLRVGDMIQLLSMTFVASQKGWDGVCLLFILVISTKVNFRFRHELVVKMFCNENGVVVNQESFEFSGRTTMLRAIQQLSEARKWRWMDGILAPCPSREAWARILSSGKIGGDSFEKEVRNLTDSDKTWVWMNTVLTVRAAGIMRTALNQMTPQAA